MRQRDAGAISGPLIGISFIAGAGGGVALADHPYPRPGSSASAIRRYFTEKTLPGRVSAAGQLISAAALLRFTASVTRLVPPGETELRHAAIAAGALSAASLTTSAACAAALTSTRGHDDATALKLHRRGFLAGGPIHGAAFGALVGTLCRAGMRSGKLPRPMAGAAVVAAASGLLSPLYLITERAAPLIPMSRATGFIVTGIAGARLARGA
jgi:hypothetical protein